MDADWLARRRSGIGGSDAAAILGLNPWKSAVQVYLDKIGDLPPIEDNEKMRWGRILEQPIAEEFARRKGMKLTGPIEIGSKVCPWMLGNIDQTLDYDEILEVKTASQPFGWGEDGSDQIPDHYALQVHHYMAIGGWKQCHVAVLIGGSDFRTYIIKADKDIERMLFIEEEKFWKEHVEKRVPPQPKSSADVKALFRRDNGSVFEADDTTLSQYHQLRSIRYQLKELEAAEEAALTAIQLKMGSATGLIHNGNILATWKTQDTARFDQKAFKEEQPEFYKDYTRTTESRVFRLKETKN